MARFVKGNKAAKGKGPKQAARRGRPPDAVRLAFVDMLNAPFDEDEKKRTPREIAQRNIVKAMSQVDELGNMTPTAFKANVRVVEYTDGPPTEKHEHTGGVELVWKYVGDP